MRMTQFTHACVRFENGRSALVIDPGVWAERTALDGADAVLITHEHPDHLDVAFLGEAAKANPDLRVWTHPDVAEKLDGLGDRVTTVPPGEVFTAAGFMVRTYGGQHALVHPEVPRVANLAFLVGEEVYHPGDSFTVPRVSVETLLVPLQAPWSKAHEVVEFVRAVQPRRIYSIHDGMLNERGFETMAGRFAPLTGLELCRLAPGDSTEL